MANNRVINYYNLGANETFDLFFLDVEETYPDSKLVFHIPDFPRKVTGLQKVVQTFLYYLLTRKGTDLINPEKGTLFVDYSTYANRRASEQAVKAALNPEIQDAVTQSKQSLNSTAPNNETRLASVEISSMIVSKDKLQLYLRVLTEAGELAAISVPFPETNLREA